MRISEWSSDVCSSELDIKLSCLSLNTVRKEQLRCHSEHLLAVGGATGGRCLIRNLPWRSAFLRNPARPERRRHGQDQAYSNHTDGRLRLRRAKRLWRRRY